MQNRATSSRRRQPARRLARSIGIGAAAGIAAAAGVRFGREVTATARTGTGHPLKHRVPDLAAGAIQPEYPPPVPSGRPALAGELHLPSACPRCPMVGCLARVTRFSRRRSSRDDLPLLP